MATATVNARPATGSDAGNNSFIWRAAFIAGLSGILFGYDASSINDALTFITTRFGLGSVGKGIVVSILLVGATGGALIGGNLADRFGRKKTILYSGVVFMAGVLITALAPELFVLLLGRLILGSAIGITSAVTPLYIAEVSPTAKRGGMVTLYQLAITIGIFIAFVVGYLLTPNGAWRLMIGLAFIPAALQFGLMFTVPESPRYLLHKGLRDDARKVLVHIRGTKKVDTEMTDIENTMKIETTSTWGDVFSHGARPALVAGMGMALIQALTGINAIMYYSTTIFEIAGLGKSQGAGAELASVTVGIVNMGVTVIAIFLVNRFGRKPLLFTGLCGMAGSLVIAAICLMMIPADIMTNPNAVVNHVVGFVLLAMVLIFVASFAFSLGPIAWLVIAEIFPLSIRGRAASFATSGNWFANFIIGFSFPLIVGLDPHRVAVAFFLYAGIAVISIFFIGMKVPETKGRTLEEIEMDLGEGFADLKK